MVLFSSIFPDLALAQERVGEATRIVNLVTGSEGGRRLAGTDPVFRNENVEAATDSRGELELRDGARIVVGANSTITLDNFVVAGDSFSQGTVSVSKGAFRLISGRSKGALNIRTPLASIGIRGTIADVSVGSGGITAALVLSGQLNVCTLTRRCILTRRVCDIIVVTSPNDISRAGFLLSARRNLADDQRTFPLAFNQLLHSPAYRAFRTACTQRAAEEARQNQLNRDAGRSGISITPEREAEEAPEVEVEPPEPPASGKGRGKGSKGGGSTRGTPPGAGPAPNPNNPGPTGGPVGSDTGLDPVGLY